MRTVLTLQKGSHKTGLWEPPVSQLSKSWTIGLMQGLYMLHAQVLDTARYPSMTTIHGSTIPADVQVVWPNWENATPQPNNNAVIRSVLRLNAPGGRGRVFNRSGCFYSSYQSEEWGNDHPGYLCGIVIGAGNTAPTPTDYMLEDMIPHGQDTTVGASKIDSNDAADMMALAVNTTQLLTTFTNGSNRWSYVPKKTFTPTSLEIYGYKAGTGADVRVQIYECVEPYTTTYDREIYSSGDVSAAGWNVAPSDWNTIALPGTPPRLYAGHLYRIFVSAQNYDAVNKTYITYYDEYAADDDHEIPQDWTFQRSVGYYTSGSTYYHEVRTPWRFNGTATPEMDYGGCGLGNILIGASSTFDIERIFTNRSGGAIDVKECGLLSHVGIKGYGGYPYLLARDTFATITVADTECLKVTYSPTITV